MPDLNAPPILFAFGLHAHQPEGNFDHVFEDHVRDVYEPFLQRATEAGFLPLTLHMSGTLLNWLERHHSAYLDRIGRLAADGHLELLLAGYYEPILPSLPREDRVEQILWMREALKSRFGVDAKGLWLTERVWEPELPVDLVEAGVEYVLVDDRHFVAAGFSRETLHAPFRTESSGKSLGVFAIDEKLRYMIPFHPPEDTATYLRKLRSQGSRLAVAADDIEKFGGWPGTRKWVYERGWLENFMGTLLGMVESGEVRLATFSQALAEVPSGGTAYLPSASYREMEEWSLPAEAFHRLSELKTVLGEERFARGDSPLVRGSHWRNFLVKYPESNRMHKKMLALSALCRERGNPEGPRRAVGRAQCNDAYWHGVFGGLYLRHIRDTVWRNLAEAEGLLRKDEGLVFENTDLDLDGYPEVWVHSSQFSALLSPHRGGSIEELTLFEDGVNLANTLTRRREPYHELTKDAGEEAADSGGEHTEHDATPSIHEIEEGLGFTELPPVDPDDRAIFLERVLTGAVQEADYQQGDYPVFRSWATEPFRIVGIETAGGENDISRAVEACLIACGPVALEKRLRFEADGTVEAHLRWDVVPFPPNAFFTTEISLGEQAEVTASPEAEIWRFPISTFSKSERGFDETVQGESILVRWPVSLGNASIRISRRVTEKDCFRIQGSRPEGWRERLHDSETIS